MPPSFEVLASGPFVAVVEIPVVAAVVASFGIVGIGLGCCSWLVVGSMVVRVLPWGGDGSSMLLCVVVFRFFFDCCRGLC